MIASCSILPVVVFLVDWVWVIWEGILGVPFQLHLRHPGLVELVRSPLPCVEPEANPEVKLSQVAHLLVKIVPVSGVWGRLKAVPSCGEKHTSDLWCCPWVQQVGLCPESWGPGGGRERRHQWTKQRGKQHEMHFPLGK